MTGHVVAGASEVMPVDRARALTVSCVTEPETHRKAVFTERGVGQAAPGDVNTARACPSQGETSFARRSAVDGDDAGSPGERIAELAVACFVRKVPSVGLCVNTIMKC